VKAEEPFGQKEQTVNVRRIDSGFPKTCLKNTKEKIQTRLKAMLKISRGKKNLSP